MNVEPLNMNVEPLNMELSYIFSNTAQLSLKNGVADCGMKTIVRYSENPCRDVALLRLYIQINTSIQQRLRLKNKMCRLG